MKPKTSIAPRRFFASRTFLLILLAVALLAAFGFARAYYQDYQVRQEIKNLENEVNKLQKKKVESIQILKYVASSSFVEDAARTKLNFKKPGEHVLVIHDANPTKRESSSASSTTEHVDTKPLSNPIKWWYYFFHRGELSPGT